MTEHLKDAALKFCNKLREKHGLKPVKALKKGYRQAAHHCTLSNTIKYGHSHNINVATCKDFVEINGNDYETPEIIHKFIEKFDKGFFPELER